MQRDIGKLTESARAVLAMVAKEGPTKSVGDDAHWNRYVINKGLDTVEGSQQLIGLGYLNTLGFGKMVYLSAAGVALAKELGLDPVPQEISGEILADEGSGKPQSK